MVDYPLLFSNVCLQNCATYVNSIQTKHEVKFQ